MKTGVFFLYSKIFTKHNFPLTFVFLLFVTLSFNINATTISSNVTYTTPISIPDDLVITDGAVVNVIGTVFSVNGDITIHPGSKLIIDNSTLKVDRYIFIENNPNIYDAIDGAELILIGSILTAYDVSWQRMEVWGGASYEKCGKLTCRESVIEKSKCAVANYHYNGDYSILSSYMPPISNLLIKRGGLLLL